MFQQSAICSSLHQSIHNKTRTLLKYNTGACTRCEFCCHSAQFNQSSSNNQGLGQWVESREQRVSFHCEVQPVTGSVRWQCTLAVYVLLVTAWTVHYDLNSHHVHTPVCTCIWAVSLWMLWWNLNHNSRNISTLYMQSKEFNNFF